MNENFVLAKKKAEELGLSGEQIKAALTLFAYTNNALKVQFYLKEEGKLGMKEIPKTIDKKIMDELTGHNKRNRDFMDDFLKGDFKPPKFKPA